MANTIVICGYGPAISHATATKFGAEGYDVALIARRQQRLDDGIAKLTQAGIHARGFVGDLSDPAATQRIFAAVRSTMGPVTILHWNAHSSGAGDLTTSDPSDLQAALTLTVTNLMMATQACLPDLQAAPAKAAILVTGGGLSRYDASVDRWAAERDTMGLAICKAAQHKLVGLLHEKLKSQGVFVGEVTVLGLVKGSSHDRGEATVEPADVATAFWEMAQQRSHCFRSVPAR